MKKNKTPKPGSPEYPLNETQKLNIPKFNSAGKKPGDEIPPVENMNDQQMVIDTTNSVDLEIPSTNLGNSENGNDGARERLIRR